MVKNKLVIAIDFDGTITTNSFPEVGELIEGANHYIQKMYQDGHYIIINTCRSGRYEGMAEDFLNKQSIPFHFINSNLPELIDKFSQDCRKISADIYIDDKCIMGLPKWHEIYELIKIKFNKLKQ